MIFMFFDTRFCTLNIVRHDSAKYFNITFPKNPEDIPFSKYQIKESDFRTKTASFTSPFYVDLTTGQYIVKISSIYHENFLGVILSCEYDEENNEYVYQCQDWSRKYQKKLELITNGSINVYKILRFLLTNGALSLNKASTSSDLKAWKKHLSGLRDIELYDQSLYKGNIVGTNPMKNKPKLIIRNKSYMDVIRDLTIGLMQYVDVWFNTNGVLQIQPLGKNDWLNTGLVLNADTGNRKFKFDTTNAITGVIVNGEGLSGGKGYSATSLLNLDLSAFFGNLNATASIKTNNTSVIKSNTKNKTNAVKKTTSSNSKTTTKLKNPFNNKNKKIIISEDGGGTSGFKSGLINLLHKDGWTVRDLGTGPGTHSRSYEILDSSYAVNLTIYNGADPATIAEPVTGWLKGKHEKYGVQLVQMFDTAGWTNPQGMKPYRYGNFDGYYCHKAWDDNYSSGNVDISNLGAWYKKYYPKVIHCCGASVSGAYAQFKAGGYFNYIKQSNNTSTSKKTTTTKKTTSKSTGKSELDIFNEKMLSLTEAKNKIYEHSRDYLSCKISLPLGDKALKEVHTNQFLFTRLPVEFDLANWTVLAEVLSANYNRFTGADYVNNRWYIEGVTIDVDVRGNSGKMDLELNALASSTSGYAKNYNSYLKNYTDAKNNQNKNKTTNKTSATKKKTNATKTKTTTLINEANVKKYNIPSVLVNVLKKICKASDSDYNKVKAWFNWMDNNVAYWYYTDHKYSEEQVVRQKGGNCVDNSRTFRLGCLALGVKCNFVKGYSCCAESCANHQWNKVYINGKGTIVDVGRSNASWGSHWGRCSGGESETGTSW